MIPPLLLTRSDAQPAGFRDVSPFAAVHHLGDLRLIDVREPDEFVGPLGHIPGAELVPVSTIPAAAAAWNRDEPVLLICRSGARSGRAATTLAGMGFRHLFNLVGGMIAWDANALPRLRDDDTPLTRAAGQVQACFIAAAGDSDIGTQAFVAATGGQPGTLAGLRCAVHTLRETGPGAGNVGLERLERRLAELG